MASTTNETVECPTTEKQTVCEKTICETADVGDVEKNGKQPNGVPCSTNDDVVECKTSPQKSAADVPVTNGVVSPDEKECSATETEVKDADEEKEDEVVEEHKEPENGHHKAEKNGSAHSSPTKTPNKKPLDQAEVDGPEMKKAKRSVECIDETEASNGKHVEAVVEESKNGDAVASN